MRIGSIRRAIQFCDADKVDGVGHSIDDIAGHVPGRVHLAVSAACPYFQGVSASNLAGFNNEIAAVAAASLGTKSFVLLTGPVTPPVFPGSPFPMVNGAIYTIAYEFRCYLLVALLGLCGLFRRPIVYLVITCLLMSTLLYLAAFEHMHPLKPTWLGIPLLTVRLTAIYLVGVCFYLFRTQIKFRPWFALAATAGATVFIILFPAKVEFAMVLSGSYLLFYLGQMSLPWLSWMSRFPDISYGIYLYGWPVESLWIWFHRGSPWVTFFASTIICFGLGWLSWHLVESPALRLKGRPSAKRSPSVPVPVA